MNFPDEIPAEDMEERLNEWRISGLRVDDHWHDLRAVLDKEPQKLAKDKDRILAIYMLEDSKWVRNNLYEGMYPYRKKKDHL